MVCMLLYSFLCLCVVFVYFVWILCGFLYDIVDKSLQKQPRLVMFSFMFLLRRRSLRTRRLSASVIGFFCRLILVQDFHHETWVCLR